jgi:hypothetical protein
VDKNKLLYFIKANDYRVDDFCKVINIGKPTFYRRCNENTFRLKDVSQIANVLNLTQDDINSIFFADLVS